MSQDVVAFSLRRTRLKGSVTNVERTAARQPSQRLELARSHPVWDGTHIPRIRNDVAAVDEGIESLFSYDKEIEWR